MTTAGVTDIEQTGATLSASYSEATATPKEVRFEYGLTASNLDRSAYYDEGGLTAPSGSFSVTLTSLEPGTTYWYRAVIQVGDKDFCGDTKSFTTADHTAPSTLSRGWLELPALNGDEDFVGFFKSGNARNYSYCYDYDRFTTLWTAYPLYRSTTGGSRGGGWKANPQIAESRQINIWDGSYGVNVGSTSSAGYDSSRDIYSRGHNIPDGDRSNESTMQSQTYYATNSTPQIQNGFNGTIWSSLEGKIRDAIPASDTLYVVTGAAFCKVGESRAVTMITPKYDSRQVPVPNYYWKVVLKVRRSGQTVTAASAVGFWMEHKTYSSGASCLDYATSVDQIEAFTGFDLFANLPDGIEAVAESNTSWTSFTGF